MLIVSFSIKHQGKYFFNNSTSRWILQDTVSNFSTKFHLKFRYDQSKDGANFDWIDSLEFIPFLFMNSNEIYPLVGEGEKKNHARKAQ